MSIVKGFSVDITEQNKKCMAQKRMLNKSISLSKQVTKLSLKHKLFFTWAIPHLDDYGLIDNDPEVLKATVCPMVKEISEKDIKEFIKKAQEPDSNGESLIEEYQDCLEFPGFTNHQSITAEKRAKMKFQKIPKNPQENNGENNNPQESPLQDKRKEEKLREEKREEASVEFLKNIPLDAIQEFTEKFNIYEKGIRKKGEEMYDWCISKGKQGQYKDFRAMLRNALRKDFGERPPNNNEEQERIRATLEKNQGSSGFAKSLKDQFKINK